MAWPFLDGTIKVVVTWGFEGKPSVNVHFVLMDTPTTPVPDTTLLIAANAMHDAITDNWKPTGSDSWTVDSIDAIDWSDEDGNSIQTDLTLPIVGLNNTQGLPSSLAVVVSQRSDHTGRSRRGRNYIPGICISLVTRNEINANWVVALGDMYSDFRFNLSLDDLEHVVLSLYSDNAPRTTPLATAITGTTVNSRIDTQRRRLPASV